jgi:hypothetical protein
MWNLTCFCFETVLVLVHSFHKNVPMAQKWFWTHPMVLLGEEAQVKAHFDPFGDSVFLDAR